MAVQAHATAKYIRTSAQKAGLVLDLIRGRDVNTALATLKFWLEQPSREPRTHLLAMRPARLEYATLQPLYDTASGLSSWLAKVFSPPPFFPAVPWMVCRAL